MHRNNSLWIFWIIFLLWLWIWVAVFFFIMLLFRQVCFHSKALSPQGYNFQHFVRIPLRNLLRSQTSLSRWKCLLFLSCGPLRFVTSHLRFALAFARDQTEAPEEEAVPKPYAGNPGCINGIYAPLTARLLNPGLAPIFNLLLIHTNVDCSKLFLLNLAAFKLSCRISSGKRENQKPWTAFIPGLRQG